MGRAIGQKALKHEKGTDFLIIETSNSEFDRRAKKSEKQARSGTIQERESRKNKKKRGRPIVARNTRFLQTAGERRLSYLGLSRIRGKPEENERVSRGGSNP